MNSISSAQLVSILENGDLALLEKVPGVGKKTAAKMLLQLKGKLTLESTSSVSSKKSGSEYSDVISALTDMGYDKTKACEAVERIAGDLSSDSSFVQSGQSGKEDIIFRRAIIELSN
jgi:Holliday junction DNA helicase RuvA